MRNVLGYLFYGGSAFTTGTREIFDGYSSNVGKPPHKFIDIEWCEFYIQPKELDDVRGQSLSPSTLIVMSLKFEFLICS